MAARRSHRCRRPAAVDVGDKIYVIGGVKSTKPGEPGAPIPLGSTDQIVVSTVEAYDPATNEWQTRSSIPQPETTSSPVR
jgi:N-acetylneuraminic acid mutarotase